MADRTRLNRSRDTRSAPDDAARMFTKATARLVRNATADPLGGRSDASHEKLNARCKKPNEGICTKAGNAGTREKSLLTLLIHRGLTPELSRAAKRLRLE